MRKKIAFLMASVMTASLLSLNVFGASYYITGETARNTPKGTYFREAGNIRPGVDQLSPYYHISLDTGLNTAALAASGRDVMFSIALTNADWALYDNNGNPTTNLKQHATDRNSFYTSTTAPVAPTMNRITVPAGTYGGTAYPQFTFDVAADAGTPSTPNPAYGSVPYSLTVNQSQPGVAWVTIKNVDLMTFTANSTVSTTNQAAYAAFQATNANVNVIDETGATVSVNPSLTYTVLTQPVATVTNNDTINIPLVFKTTEENEPVVASIYQPAPILSISGYNSSQTVISTSNIPKGYIYAEVPANKMPNSQYTFFLSELNIGENVYGAFVPGGTYTITAPTGYRFVQAVSTTAPTTVAYAGAYTPHRIPEATVNNGISFGTDGSSISVTAPNITTNYNTGTGLMSIRNLHLVASNTNLSGLSLGAIKAKLTGPRTGSNTNIDFEFQIANAVERNLTFNVTDTNKAVPTLVTGRFHPENMTASGTPSFNAASDSYHKTARVTFKENAPNSWNSLDRTVFTLPEGVKFIKVEITDTSELANQQYINGSSQQLSNLKDEVAVNNGTIPGYSNFYVNERDLVFRNINTSGTKAASITFDMWVSIDPEFAPADGSSADIALSVSKTGLSDEYGPLPDVVIAKAVRPVKVDTKVTDVKIGYQVIPTADITITENAAGYLLRDSVIALSTDVLDGITVSTKDIKSEVTAGDIQLAKVAIANTGTGTTSGYGFRVVKPSSKISTIKLSNVALTVNRAVPFSNAYNYKVFVGGTATAANYVYRYYTQTPGIATINHLSRFTTEGVSADYMRVTSPSTEPEAAEVRVKIGSNMYTKNGTEVSMPDGVAAYLSTESDSTMVPVRFISNALGIPDDSIIWDDAEKTVTILMPSKTVQFRVGSSKMLVNGTAVTMITETGKEIKAENKNDRVYIPFKQLGKALGVNVIWEDAEKTAVFNPGNETKTLTGTTTTTNPAA